MELLEIDGSVLEGGGQILRNAISLSCILQRPIKISKIRAGRPKPGLATQHLFGIQLLQQITKGKLIGDSIGSTTIEFYPGKIHSGKYYVDTNTAASISLVLQVALPVLIFGKEESHLEVKGGTNADMAPPIDFVTEILRPNLEMFGVTFDFELFKRGYYPKGGGRCHFTIPPVKTLNAIKKTDFGFVDNIFGWCYVAGVLPLKVAEEIKSGAQDALDNVIAKDKINIEAYKESREVGRENGSGVILGAATSTGCILGSSFLGDRKTPPWTTGNNAGKQLLTCLQNKQCTDQHVQDQLIIYMALADGTSTIQTGQLTTHTLTVIYIAEQMTGIKFETSEVGSGIFNISCKGIGIVNKS